MKNVKTVLAVFNSIQIYNVLIYSFLLDLFQDALFKFFFDNENISTLLQIHDFFGRLIFYLPWDLFNKNDGISTKILFRGKVLCSDESKWDKIYLFKRFCFVIDIKIGTLLNLHKTYFWCDKVLIE